MGCNISVSLPPVPGSDDEYYSCVGQDVRWCRAFASQLTSLGIPSLDEDGCFADQRSVADLVRTRDAIRSRRDELSSILDTPDGQGSDDVYHTWCYLREWLDLYDMVVALQQRGVPAHLFGA